MKRKKRQLDGKSSRSFLAMVVVVGFFVTVTVIAIYGGALGWWELPHDPMEPQFGRFHGLR